MQSKKSAGKVSNKILYRVKIIAMMILFFGIASELFLKFVLGLSNPPLFISHPMIGYCYAPNQNLLRWQNRIYYNDYHQRSENLNPHSDYRILMLGDSILNGGTLCDQQQTISEKWEQLLNQKKADNKSSNVSNQNELFEVLNASAASWGIPNEWAYLQSFGTFKADCVVLVLGTSDLIQEKSTAEVLGSRNYPTENFYTAWGELLSRYIATKLFADKKSLHTTNTTRPAKDNILVQNNTPAQNVQNNTPAQNIVAKNNVQLPIQSSQYTRLQNNLAVLQEMKKFLESQNIPFLIVRIPELTELAQPINSAPLDKESSQKSPSQPINLAPLDKDFLPLQTQLEIFHHWILQHNIVYLNLGSTEHQMLSFHFYDRVHLNPIGNAYVAEKIHDIWRLHFRKSG